MTATTAATLDEAVRVRRSANPATAPDALVGLAGDVSVTVRAALAMNPATPLRATEMLARDADERVRALLARRLAALIPGASAGEHRRIEDRALMLLHRLVNDEAERVRAAIADIVKDMPEAPRELIVRLANDAVGAISRPVVELSPVLTDEDLLALLASPPCADTASAVARRPGLSALVADAILAGEDSAAIRALLENGSAQIREAALDALIAGAADHADWHEPLVRRPALSARAARALAGMVTAELLKLLAARQDLGVQVIAELRTALEARLAPGSAVVTTEPGTEEALLEAYRLRDAGGLTEAALLQALYAGRVRLATAMLAVAAAVPMGTVNRAVSLRSTKGLVSLVWSAGFGMAAAGAIQTVIGHIPPASVIEPAADGGFPLAQEEMRWQLGFLRQVGR